MNDIGRGSKRITVADLRDIDVSPARAEIKPRKLKVVFCVTDCATGSVVAGSLPVDGDEMFQLVVEYPFLGTDRIPDDRLVEWVGDVCLSKGEVVGKKIGSVLTSLVLEK
jgi:hypothetical protein